MRQKAIFIFKLLLSAGIFSYLVVCHGDRFADTLCQANVKWFIVGVLLYLVQIVACALRWRSLSKDMGFLIPARTAVSLTFSSLFVSLVMPGGVLSSDIAKICMVASYAQTGTRAESVATIIIDRIVGMMGMFILTIICLPFAAKLILNINWNNELDSYINWGIILSLLLISCLGVVAPIILIGGKHIHLGGCCLKLFQKISRGGAEKFFNAVIAMREHRKNLWHQIIFCVFSVHLMSCLTAWCMVAAVRTSNECSFFPFMAAIMIGNVAALIPLFPGGIGGRDFVIYYLLSAAGCTQGVVVTLLNTLAIICGNLFGGVFLFFRTTRR